MGWSCSKAASEVMEKWEKACRDDTGSQNTYTVNGNRYFFEVSRREHHDGAITGTIQKFIGETHARIVSSFRIEGNGTITRGPKILKDANKK